MSILLLFCLFQHFLLKIFGLSEFISIFVAEFQVLRSAGARLMAQTLLKRAIEYYLV